MADLDELLDANPPQTETAVTVAPSKPRRHRHMWAWELRPVVEVNEFGPVYSPNSIARCEACGVERDPARSRRGRTNRQRGNAQERDWCKRLGLRRVGHYGGPEDGIGEDGMFVGQAKSLASARFPSWLSTELAKLPRSEGRIPILGLLETPGPGRRPRRLVVIEESDWIALHVAKEEA